MTTATRPPLADDVRARIADYEALALYDRKRYVRYGDMARSRRGREIDRLAHKLIYDDHVPVDRTGNFPAIERDELAAAFKRVVLPRCRRFLGEPGATFRTPHARATADAYRAAAREAGLDLEALLGRPIA